MGSILPKTGHIILPPAFAGCGHGPPAAQPEQEKLNRVDSEWGPLLQAAVLPLEVLGSTRYITVTAEMRT